MTEPTPQDPRVVALERRLRRLHAVLVTMFALVLATIAYQFAPRPAVVEAREFVLRDARDRGAAVLLSSHDFEAMAIADRVVLLAGGVLVGEATRGPEGEGASWRERIDQLGHGVGSC